jgi:hypothetical protein
MAIDRVIDTNSPTQPMEVVPRPRSTKPIPQDAEPVRESGRRKTVPLADDSAVPVSPQRRNAGRLIAIGLLAVLVIGAAYFVIRQARSVTTETTGAPPGSPRH